MKWARIINNTIAEVVTQDPATLFTEQVAAMFVPVSEDAEYRATWDEDTQSWIPVPPPQESTPEPTEPPVIYAKVSPVEFMLLFNSPERVAIKSARIADPIIDDFLDIIEDPRLTVVDLGLQSTQNALSYFVALSILTEERKAEILLGQIQ